VIEAETLSNLRIASTTAYGTEFHYLIIIIYRDELINRLLSCNAQHIWGRRLVRIPAEALLLNGEGLQVRIVLERVMRMK